MDGQQISRCQKISSRVFLRSCCFRGSREQKFPRRSLRGAARAGTTGDTARCLAGHLVTVAAIGDRCDGSVAGQRVNAFVQARIGFGTCVLSFVFFNDCISVLTFTFDEILMSFFDEILHRAISRFYAQLAFRWTCKMSTRTK